MLTVFLALGAWRISRHGVLTRRMPAIETLGSATVLCVDKTGTLTENRMAVVDAMAPAAGRRGARADGGARSPASSSRSIRWSARSSTAEGDAGARACARPGRWSATTRSRASFSPCATPGARPRASARVAIKGAPETVLALCRLDGDAIRSADCRRSSARAAAGLRLLAVAEAGWDGARVARPIPASIRSRGWASSRSPIRCAPTCRQAIAQCRGAGMRVVMITGDYPGTALAIARAGGHRDRRRRAHRRGARGDGRRRARAGGAARQRLRAHPARAEAAAHHRATRPTARSSR